MFETSQTGGRPDEREPFVLHPLPVPSRCCGMILQATYAAAADFCCPQCGAEVCYTCGCVEHAACTVTVTSPDGSHSTRYACGWAAPGLCSFCYWRAAYEMYQEATGRAKDDPFYMSLGATALAVKGLDWGLGS